MRFFNCQIEETAKTFTTAHNDEKELEKKLISLKTLDLKLVELSVRVGEYFKWFLLLNISADIIVITIDVYWIYGGFMFGDNPYFLRKFCSAKVLTKPSMVAFSLESSLTPCGKTIALILIFAAGSSVKAEKEKSPAHIFHLYSKSQSAVNSKRRFLLQKLHTIQYQLNGNGFFFINYGTLVGVSGLLCSKGRYYTRTGTCQPIEDF